MTLQTFCLGPSIPQYHSKLHLSLWKLAAERSQTCWFSPFQTLRAFVHGYMVACDRSDNFVEDNPFLLPEKMRFPSNQQASLFCHELTHGVGRSGSRKKM